MSKHTWKTRVSALAMASLLAAGCTLPTAAAEPVSNGVTPTYDEAYYAMLDYYGNLTNGSVVKSYRTNGFSSLTDYGEYDEVVNLTDGSAPLQSSGKTVFQFPSGDIPGTFYFEGKTAKPFENLPWTLSVSYTLNGVPMQAEELAGKTGTVEICLNAVPNPAASEYARNNYTLEAMAVFNQDDILSLEAPGAQVQLIGNLRAVLFLGLPGEECHYSIRVGSDDFTFGGLTFLMVPATLSQLEEISKLSDRKDELEDDYHRLSGSLDSLLDALNAMTGSLNASASGLDQLNRARDIFSGGKDVLYQGTDALRSDLTNLSQVLEPVEGQIEALSQTISNSKAVLNRMNGLSVSLREELDDLTDALKDLEKNGDLNAVLNAAGKLSSSLNDLQTALGGTRLPTVEISGTEGSDFKLKTSQVKKLHKIYDEAYQNGTADTFFTAMLRLQGQTDDAIAAALSQLNQTLLAVQGGLITIEQVQTQNPSAALLIGLYLAKSSTSFQSFCEKVLPVQYPDKTVEEIHELAKQANDLWLVYESGEAASSHSGEDGTLSAALLFNDSPDAVPQTLDGQEDANGKANDAAIDLIASGVDKAASQIKALQTQLSSAMQSLADATVPVLRDLSRLCSAINRLDDTLDTADDLSKALRGATHEISSILQAAEELQALLDAYEPTLQETLSTVNSLSTTAAQTIRDTEKLTADLEALLRSVGTPLDEGTRQSLDALAAVLRGAAKAVGTTGEIKASKSTICDIIEDTWDDYTGDVNNLLLMDATAEAVSLTDSRNPAPQSVQVLIRTQEITKPEEETAEAAAPAAKSTTLWGRIVQMFRDFWTAITGLFGGKD